MGEEEAGDGGLSGPGAGPSPGGSRGPSPP